MPVTPTVAPEEQEAGRLSSEGLDEEARARLDNSARTFLDRANRLRQEIQEDPSITLETINQDRVERESRAQNEAVQTRSRSARGARQSAAAENRTGDYQDTPDRTEAEWEETFSAPLQTPDAVEPYDYLGGTGEMPEGWQATPEELERLVSTRAGGRGTISSPQDAWNRGKLQAEQQQRRNTWSIEEQALSSAANMAENDAPFVEILREEMERHQNRPQFHYREFGGDETIDTPVLFDQLQQRIRDHIVVREGWTDLESKSQAQRDWLDQETDRLTNLGLPIALQMSGGRSFADPFHRDLTADIADDWFPFNIIRTYFSPIHYGTYRNQLSEYPSPEERAEFTGNRIQWNTISPLMNLARMEPLSYAASAWSAGEFSGEKIVEVIRTGDDVIYHTPQIIGLFSDILGDEEGETSILAKWGGVATLIYAMIKTPDAFSLALSPTVGSGMRSSEILSRIGKLEDSEDMLDAIIALASRTPGSVVGEAPQARTAVEPLGEIRDILSRIGAQDVSTQNAVGALYANTIGSATRVSGNTADRMIRSIDKAREASESAATRLEAAVEVRRTTGSNEEATRAVVELYEARSVEQRLALAEIDNRRELWLAARGISEKEAKGIYTASAYSEAIAPGARAALDEAVADAEKVFGELQAAYSNPRLLTDPDAEKFIGDRLEDISERLAEFSSKHKTPVGPLTDLSHLPPEIQARGQRLIEEFQELLELGGPDYRKLLEAQEALAAARVTRRELDAVPTVIEEYQAARRAIEGPGGTEALLNVATARLVPTERASLKARQVVAQREVAALKAEDRLVKAEGARGSLIESMTTVRDSFKALRGQIAERAGVSTRLGAQIKDATVFRSLPDRLRRRGQAIKGGWNLSRAQVKELGLRVDLDDLQRQALKIEEKVLSKAGDGKVTVDGGELLDEVTARVGADNLTTYLKEPEMESLRVILDRGAKSLAAREGGLVEITSELWDGARNGIERIVTQEAVEKVNRGDTLWARTISTAWRDSGFLDPKDQARAYKVVWNNVTRWAGERNAQSVMAQRLGIPITEELADIRRATENLLSRMQREMTEFRDIENMAVAQHLRVRDYIDLRSAATLKVGKTRAAEVFESGNIWDNGSRQILNDTRRNPLSEALKSERVEGAKRDLRRRLTKTLEQSGVGAKESKELLVSMEKLTDSSMEALESGLRPGVDLADSALPKSIVALSRMFLDGSTLGRISGEIQAILILKARKHLLDATSFQAFSTKMEKSTKIFLGGSVSLAPKTTLAAAQLDKAYILGATSIAGAASLGYMTRRLERLYAGVLTPDIASDINRILTGAPGVRDFEGALNAMNSLGLHAIGKAFGRNIATSLSTPMGKMVEFTKEFIEVGTSKGGSTFAPKGLIDAFEAEFGKIIKTIEPVTPVSRAGKDGLALRAYASHLHLWRQAVVTGLILPNPRYWVNNILADQMQMWQEVGLKFSVIQTSSNLLSNAPYWAKWSRSKDNLMQSATWARFGKEVPVLPGILESMFDGTLVRVFAGKNGSFVTKGGRPITYKTLRKWALEDGIMEDFVHETLKSTMKELEWNLLGKKSLSEWNGVIADHAGAVQQRQRLGMYYRLLEGGATRAEAKKRTLAALYDWKHGIAQDELRVWSKISPFYRFWKLATRQFINTTTDPFVMATGATMKKALRGDTRFRRLQVQVLLAGHGSDLIDPELKEDIIDQARQIDLLARSVIPKYYRQSIAWSVNQMTDKDQWDRAQETGVISNYSLRKSPPITSIGAGSMVMGTFVGLQSLTAKLLGGSEGRFGIVAPGNLGLDPTGDWEAAWIEELLSASHPLADAVTRAMLAQTSIDLGYDIQSSDKMLNPTEESAYLTMKSMPFLGDLFPPAEPGSNGRLSIPWGAYMMWKNIPLLGTTGRYFGAVNAAQGEDTALGSIREGLAALTGFGEKKYFNMGDQMDRIVYERNEQLQHLMEQYAVPAGGINVRQLRSWEDQQALFREVGIITEEEEGEE